MASKKGGQAKKTSKKVAAPSKISKSASKTPNRATKAVNAKKKAKAASKRAPLKKSGKTNQQLIKEVAKKIVTVEQDTSSSDESTEEDDIQFKSSCHARAKDSQELRHLKQHAESPKTGANANQPPAVIPKILHAVLGKLNTTVESTDVKSNDFVKIGDVLMNRFRITAKLREGGFGQIYKAIDEKMNREVAAKFELIEDDQPNLEALVLTKFAESKFCPKLFAKGVLSKKYTFVVMQLLGKNLTELRRACPLKPPRLSIPTTFKLSVQCLRAVEALHELGFVHRDIKPSNFVMGTERDEQNNLYMLDYGLAKYYKKKDGSIRASRTKVGFRGTLRYASLSSHDNLELGRRDDMISMFYSYFELLVGQLPWIMTEDNELVTRTKRVEIPEKMCRWTPPEMLDYVKHVDQLKYEDKPNYALLVNCINNSAKRLEMKSDEPFDWQVVDCKILKHWTVTEDCFKTQEAEN